MILKMDVEGAEYGFLYEVNESTLLQFDQMVFEFHNLLNLCENCSDYINAIFSKLNKTHATIHVHANNWDDVLVVDGEVYPNVIEVSYVKREAVCLNESEPVNLPNTLDRPCWKGHREIVLGRWN